MAKTSKQKIKISLIIIIAFLTALFIPKYENADVSVSYPDTQVIKGASKVEEDSIKYDENGYITEFSSLGTTVTFADIKNEDSNGKVQLGYMFAVSTVSGSNRNIC